MTINLLQ